MRERWVCLIVVGLTVVAASRLNGQGTIDADLAERCAAAGIVGDDLALCRDVIAAVQLTQPELGLALAGGNPVLGTASPIGTKFRFIPRIQLGGRMSFVWGNMPEILDYPGSDRAGESRGYSLIIPQVDLSVGVFDGFDLGATLGGLGAVELLGSLNAMILPGGAGFKNDVGGLGLGARVGVIRESFTAPGVSVSAQYKWTGRVEYGAVGRSDDAQFGLNQRVLSLRAGLSKSFVALGLAFTLGWDRYAGDVDFGIAEAPGSLLPVVPELDPVSLTTERWSAFVDVAYIVLFLNFVAEAGWQEERSLVASGGSQVDSGKFLGAIGLRMTF
ncbi:MAG: hypothetical protein JSU87_03480 [Gemmatimonadota bacterium]|nr:MAG: hypothetical protein JSU87_03480 [Gemmatimonadota bacterium]